LQLPLKKRKGGIMPTATDIVPEIIENKIFLLRGKKVMLDFDLAALYGVETKQLKRAVKRNAYRFPADFMFPLTKKETAILRCQNGTSSWGGKRYLSYAFTEHGVLMLSSVLKSKRAILVNIQIMRAFTKLRQFLLARQDLQIKLEQILRKQEKQRGKLQTHDQQIAAIFDAIKQLLQNDRIIQKQITYTEEKERNKKWGIVPR
jgi:phage regulator Rha-like protein